VERRILLCALAVGALALTLALSSRHNQQRSDVAPSARAALQPHDAMASATGAAVPVAAAPPAAAMNPPTAIAPPAEQSEPQSEPNSAPVGNADSEEEKTLAQRDRGTERSARSR